MEGSIKSYEAFFSDFLTLSTMNYHIPQPLLLHTRLYLRPIPKPISTKLLFELDIDRQATCEYNVYSVIDANMQYCKKQLIFIFYCHLLIWASAKNLYDEYNDKLDLLSDYETRREETSEFFINT